MKLTIIMDDKTVYKDKVSFSPIDLSTTPSNVHALQFDTVSSTGHIEFTDGTNQEISSLPDWAVAAVNNYDSVVDAYNADQAAKQAAYLAAKG